MNDKTDKIESTVLNFRLVLGEEIKNVREQKGLNQEQLAEIMGVSRSTISKIENGKFSISVDYLARFSIYLDHEFKVLEKQ
ncbi:MAG TPA: helix-turn-helix transcriptional regulator [Prolixibacteraceae bacterium]|nr:helix-turn-helix transcriptional regulator [Prolixibacteraceae bacterium]HQN93267.1 helix-turn-helix transcriptional regulator [Prolixibacteraceae bacterium]